jgi:hypothetical protein
MIQINPYTPGAGVKPGFLAGDKVSLISQIQK